MYGRKIFMSLAVLLAISLALLPEEQIVHRVAVPKKLIALTFDDGPNPQTTPRLLKVLQEKKVRATFFILGENAANYPDILAKTAAAGHEIGSHSFTHRHLPTLSAAECARELEQAEEVIGRVVQQPLTLFRPPGGLYNDMVLAETGDSYKIILWSLDTLDWKKPPAAQIIKIVSEKVKAGDIVLLHDGISNLPTPQAVAVIIDRLRERGYEFVTVGELLRYRQLRE